MAKRNRLTVLVLGYQKEALLALAQAEGEAVSVTVRRLIVREARRCGLLPETASSKEELSGDGKQ